MTEQIAIIIDKKCGLCIKCDVDNEFVNLICKLDNGIVGDNYLCKEFEASKEVLQEVFLDIKEIKDYEI